MHFLSLGRWTLSGIATLNAAQGFERIRGAMEPLGVQVRWCFWLPLGGSWDTAVFWEARTLTAVCDAKRTTYRAGNSNVDTFLLDPLLQEDLSPTVSTYLSLGRWSSEGMRSAGTSGQLEEMMRQAEALGVRLRAVYWILSGAGFDVAVISQTTDVDVLAAFRLQTLHGGRIVTEIHPLVAEDDLLSLKRTAFGELRLPTP